MLKILKFSSKKLLEKKISSGLLILFLIFGFCLILLLEITKSYFSEITNIIYSSKISENKLIIEKGDLGLSKIFRKKTTLSFSKQEIEKIRNLENIKKVFLSSNFNAPAVMSISMLGNKFTTDVFFEGIDENIISKKFKKFNFNENYIPLVVSEKIIDSLIKVFIKDDNIKNITKKLILSKEFDITFGESNLKQSNTDRSLTKKGRIVTFGEGSNFIFISIPLKNLEKINEYLNLKTNIDKLFIEPSKNADLDILQIEIEKLGFNIINIEKQKEKMKNIINLFYKIGLLVISIILILITYCLTSFIIIRIIENKKDNSIMWVLGISKKTIDRIYIFESFVISIIGLIISLPIIYYIIKIVNNYINSYNSIHSFIRLPNLHLDKNSLLSLIIFFIIINFISIAYYYLKTHGNNKKEI